MRGQAPMDSKKNIQYQSEEHDIIDADGVSTVEEFVLHLMHRSDYERVSRVVLNADVLDLGCNSGYGTEILSQYCRSIVGVDVSPRAIEMAKEKVKRKNVQFSLIDGFTLPFKNNSFDCVASFQVVEHIQDYGLFFDEIKRVLKPDGLLILTTPNAEIRVKPGDKPWNPFHVHEFSSSELDELLSKYFRNVHLMGQFATEKTYAIEYGRCVAMRDRKVVEQSQYRPPALLTAAVQICPEYILKKYRKLKAKIKARELSKKLAFDRGPFTTEDFFYEFSNLEKSLTLIAVCAEVEISETTLNAFLLSTDNK